MKSGEISDSGYMYGFICLLAVAILFSLAMFTLLISPSYISGETAYSSLKVLTDNLALTGHVTGYADMTTGTPAPQTSAGYSGLAAVRLNLRLASLRMSWATGSGDDLSQATVTVQTPQGTETIPWRTTSPLTRPGWSIIKKGALLPGTSANTNNILEPNEIFTIIVSPSWDIQAGTPFTVTMSIPDVQPLTVSRIVPSPIKPVMDLG